MTASTPTSHCSERVRAVLLLRCDDRPGIVARVGAFVAAIGGNIVEADQHSDPEAGLFLQRIEFDGPEPLTAVHEAFVPMAQEFAMDWSLHDQSARARIAILVSRQGHCLADLLARVSLDELPADVAAVGVGAVCAAGAIGRCRVKALPRPASVETDTRPPISSMIRFTRLRPRPLP